MKLLIVESPGKLKTLRKILGSEWILEASVGHTTELAHDGFKNLGFEIKPDQVITRYVPRGTRGKQVLSKLRAAAKQADQVYLAMDPDREGEAIAWHLVEQLKLKKYVRVAYTQITESAVKAAIRSPRPLDFPLIEAQRARQCLDKLVGFEVSPLLWKTTGGKSAGRVQSATLHLVCERERERLAFQPKDYWTLHSHYDTGLIAQYEPLKVSKSSDPKDADFNESGKVESKLEADEIEKIARTHSHKVSKIEDREEKRLPPAPFITSSLQQMAGVRFKYSPQKTMKIAQELYEGVGGQSGLITYMRTDAVSLSPEFIQEARQWLSENAPEALADKAPTFRSKSDSQGAHEAIRPTSAFLTPEKAKSFLNSEQLSVYRLIWERAMASQCRPARLAKSQVEIWAGKTRWIARGSRVIELGYLQFWKNIEDERILPKMQEGQILNLKDVKVEKKTTQPPSRYSEAKLVQLMEKLGIGRPSTYASTVMTLKERDYIVLEKDVLAPTPLGMATDDVLMKALPDLVDVNFTAQMEKSLDQIAENKIGWQNFLSHWNSDYFVAAVHRAQDFIRGLPQMHFASTATFDKSNQSFRSTKSSAKSSSRSRTSRSSSRSGFSSSAKPNSRSTKRSTKKSAAAKKAKSLDPSKAPICEHGHGPLEARVSKKGDPYWKCREQGCDSWLWPK